MLFFLLSRRRNRDGKSYKTKVSGIARWVREPSQARKDFADSQQAEVGRARCPGNSGIYTLSWEVLSIMFWLADLEFGNVVFGWASPGLQHKSTGMACKEVLAGLRLWEVWVIPWMLLSAHAWGCITLDSISWMWTLGSRGLLRAVQVVGGWFWHMDAWDQLEKYLESVHRDFPGGPVAKTPCCQCRGHGVSRWLGN